MRCFWPIQSVHTAASITVVTCAHLKRDLQQCLKIFQGSFNGLGTHLFKDVGMKYLPISLQE